MSPSAADLAMQADALLFAGFAVFLRIGAAMTLLPAFGEAAVPGRVRLGLAVAFTLVVMPAASPALALPDSLQGLLLLILSETGTGLAIGLAFRLTVTALSMAGVMIAQATSLSQVFPSGGSEALPAASQLMVVSGLALATLSGLHVQVSVAFIRSYDVIAPGSLPEASRLLDWVLGQAGGTMSVAFSLAAPFLAASLAYNLALGAINRAMPQLMVSLVGAPALSLAALALMSVAVPAGLAHWIVAVQPVLEDPLGERP